MDLQQLRYFVSVAEHLNFTQAAKELFISQPALSKQILNLEKYFGVQLFIRDKRFLRITEAGDILLNEAYEILAKIDQTKHKVFEVVSGCTGKLKIGYIGSVEKNILPQITRTFRYHYPGLNLSIIRRHSETLKTGLIHGDIDLGFIFLASLGGTPELDWEVIYSGNLKIALPYGHPLSKKKKISISELAEESFVFPIRETCPHYDYLINMCKIHGFSPKIVAHEVSPEEILLLVESGIGIAILSDLCETLTNHVVNFVKLEENYIVQLAVTWNKQIHNPAVPLFIRKVKETVQSIGGSAAKSQVI